jgi:GAF domain-containing protein
MEAEPIGDAAVASGFRVPATSAAMARIAAVTGELAAAQTMDDIVTVVASHVREAVQAAVSVLILRDGDQLRVAGQRGVAAEKASRWATFALADANPASEAVRTGQPVVAATQHEVRRRYPAMAADTPPQRSVVDLPLRAGGQVIGAIGLTFEQNWEPGPFELEFLMTFADACAQAIRRVQATERADASSTQLQILAQASAELSRSLDYRQTLSNVAQLSVPSFADWCAVDLLVEDTLATLAVAHVDPGKVAWAQKLRQSYPPDMAEPTGAPNVIRTGIGELYRDITDDMLTAGARDEEHLRLTRELDPRSVIIVPLSARSHTLGTMTLIRTGRGRNFDHADLLVAEDLGRRAGVAIDNARLYQETANVAMQLQRAVLPDRLAGPPLWDSAAYYHPDGRADVGGDFYDCVDLPDGRVALFIGDVMGHGIPAAAAMAQMRASIRAFLTVGPEPEVVMGKLDTMFTTLAIAPLVSLIYAVVDAAGRARVANAGNCPALYIDAAGTTIYLHAGSRPLLGTGPAVTPITELTIEPGGTLLLYTDGLVERRNEHIDTGLNRLASHASAVTHGPLDIALADIAGHVAGNDVHDDVALIAIRRTREV